MQNFSPMDDGTCFPFYSPLSIALPYNLKGEKATKDFFFSSLLSTVSRTGWYGFLTSDGLTHKKAITY
jgi:hypothetical protein